MKRRGFCLRQPCPPDRVCGWSDPDPRRPYAPRRGGGWCRAERCGARSARVRAAVSRSGAAPRRREVDAAHHLTILGWARPLTRQLAQLAVLVFVFSRVLKLGIPDYPVFVFSGLIAWSWFATGTAKATGSLIEHRHLLFQPRFPARVVPIVAIVVPLVDVLFALPVLLLMLGLGRGLALSVLDPATDRAPAACVDGRVRLLLAAASVFFRDMANLVGVALLLIFLDLTPVFYSRHNFPASTR